MKKITAVATSVLLTAGLLSSCVKERVCECTYTENGERRTEVVEITSTGGVTKMACEMMAAGYEDGSCKMK